MKDQIKKLEKQIKNKKEIKMTNQKKEFNIFDIAKYLLDNCLQKYGSGITQIQKLLYYVQGEYLIRYYKPLFNEEIQFYQYLTTKNSNYHVESI
ncbi:hypothetical protein CWO85_02085 [Candidatus Phytoplasma ziziphi]|uniref:Uncharacterized protein n=1 Tax=Ziziphus jujuba witches'-broom phytoplasma TaxID=135727 RepID=A0A660HMG2_ZIZJU|nr:hypothetical protein [Candidatus Phytoplasma ziziphi]AYJ01205.1 hypothetical protein CWO85_01525 [Candidatus Phytoplasma ziziphi]AYJ01302.1 hypothetical protein CWO85_02085 [Candidatus Phytoplasma ziziphi]